MLKEKLKREKGIAGADALIAILICTLFTGLIATLSYNVYLLSGYVKRSVVANNYVIDFYENVEKIAIENTTETDLINYINEKNDEKIAAKAMGSQQILETPYKMEISVQEYTPQNAEESELSLVKIVSISLKYKVGSKEHVINIQRIKARD